MYLLVVLKAIYYKNPPCREGTTKPRMRSRVALDVTLSGERKLFGTISYCDQQ